MNAETRHRYPGWLTPTVFLLAALIVGGAVAGPGLTWDEPAYRGSQLLLQEWLGEILRTGDSALFGADEIHHYWEYNRFGPNMHPPMGGYLNLLSFGVFGRWLDDVCARRLASAFELAGVAAVLCSLIGRRFGWAAGLFAAATLLTTPRVAGDAHVIGTDMPMLFFWTTTAATFLAGVESRAWQWGCGLSTAALFLVKFSGTALVAALILWWTVAVLLRHRNAFGVWVRWTAVLLIPLAPTAFVVLSGNRTVEQKGLIAGYLHFAGEYPLFFLLPLFWPAIVLCCFYSRRRSATAWHIGLEAPWVVLAVAPLAAIAANPTWWHDTIPALASYFDLNLHRRDKLPDIGVFYLGKRYLYSLPWHNAFVLMAVTIPWTALLLGLLGCVLTVFKKSAIDEKLIGRDWRSSTPSLAPFLLLQALILPFFRMLPTPAHDGVRLFLPTFVFWAGLAALAANWIASGRRTIWALLFAIGPGWASVDWIRTHPYELSYYNIGLRRAVDYGFEASYWYDAVTPRVLADLNSGPRPLPHGAPVLIQLDALINTETFCALQSLGRLRADLRLNPEVSVGEDWAWLLTHSSKATALTRLAYSCKPWYETGFDGVRLFSVLEPRAVNIAFALASLTLTRGQMSPAGPVAVLYEPAFAASDRDYRTALKLYRAHAESAETGPAVESLLRHWRSNAFAAIYLPLLERTDSGAVDQALAILTERPNDVRMVLTTPGYLRPEHFGGYFPLRRESP